MKKLIVLLPFVMLFLSCNKQQMSLTPAAYTVQSELVDHSPIYIEKDEDGVNAKLNQANKVGGTNFVFNVEKSLNVKQVAELVQKIKDTKYEEDKMHTDDKGVFYSYADTVVKQLAFFPFQNINYAFQTPTSTDNLLYLNETSQLVYQDNAVQKNQLTEVLNNKDSIQLGIDAASTFESYLQLRILLNELQLESKFKTTDLIY